MNTSNTSGLDADELLHLAVAASDRDATDQAIGLLKRAVEVAPGHANAHYLLGAEHAQIGMFERAIGDMHRAVELDPDLHAARFQLGMLLLTSRQVDAAASIWQGLDKLGPNHFYVLFKAGLLHLARDEFGACIESLRTGMAVNTVNHPLNVDMQRIVQQVEGVIAQNAAGEVTSSAPQAASGHLLINAYTDHKRQ
jgi:tetratricopeptide (TPR) repeat protein